MTAPWTAIIAAAKRMLIALSGAPSPKQFERACRQIVQQHKGHQAHRQLDHLTNEVLSSFGYGDGLRVFMESSARFHEYGDHREDGSSG